VRASGSCENRLRRPRMSRRGVLVGIKHTKAYRGAGGRGGLGDNSLEVHLLRVATACYESSLRK
jgi:hypothetical protein